MCPHSAKAGIAAREMYWNQLSSSTYMSQEDTVV